MSSTQPSTMARMVVFFVCSLEELFVKMGKDNCRVILMRRVLHKKEQTNQLYKQQQEHKTGGRVQGMQIWNFFYMPFIPFSSHKILS